MDIIKIDAKWISSSWKEPGQLLGHLKTRQTNRLVHLGRTKRKILFSPFRPMNRDGWVLESVITVAIGFCYPRGLADDIVRLTLLARLFFFSWPAIFSCCLNYSFE